MPEEGTDDWAKWSSKVRSFVIMKCPFCDKPKHTTEVGDFPDVHLVKCLALKQDGKWVVDDTCSQLQAPGFRSSKRFQNMRDKVRKCMLDQDRSKTELPKVYESTRSW